MRNLVKEDGVIEVKAPAAGLLPGDVFVKDSLVGIAYGSGQQDELVRVKTTGIFEIPKTSAQAWTQGKKVYWTGSEATTTATGNALIGLAADDAPNPSDTGHVKIGPVL